MTLQKAMRVRSEMKKQIGKLNDLLKKVPYAISFKNEVPDEKKLSEKRKEKLLALDGMSYTDTIRKQFLLNEELYKINLAIERVNLKGKELLLKETMLKSKIAEVDILLNQERAIISEAESFQTNYDERDANGAYLREKVITYSYPIIDDKDFGMSLVQLKKNLTLQIEDVRDQLSAFNSTQAVDYEIPVDLI